MQNDIYPRFLNSREYQIMLKKGREIQPGGRGFFAKLQQGLRKSKLEANLKDATGISPNLPQRYARRQVRERDSRSSSVARSTDLSRIYIRIFEQLIMYSLVWEIRRNAHFFYDLWKLIWQHWI